LTDDKILSDIDFTETEIMDISVLETSFEDHINDFINETKHLENMQVFKTAEGKIGYARAGVREGDMICLFNASPVFHVLRREAYRTEGTLGDRYETYRFMGDAYVHGWMKGETEDMDFEERDIVLV
jgi:hypothetical protein